MRSEDFQKLIADAGLNLHLSYACRFVVTLRVAGRVQSCTLVLDPEMTEDEIRAYVTAKKVELEDAARTQQGRMAEERPQEAQARPVQKVVRAQSTIGYPAH